MKTIRAVINIFIGTFLMWGCFNTEDYDTLPIATNEQLKFISESVVSVLADGVSSATISVRISNKASPGRRTVSFKTSAGSFVNGNGDSITVPATKEFIATANLVGLRPVTASVTAKIQNLQSPSLVQVQFIKAYPTTITVEVDSFAVLSNYQSEVQLRAILRRSNGGKPSIGHEVRFEVTRLDGSTTLPVGEFLNNRATATTDADGKAKIRYTPGVIDFPGGFITVRASTDTSPSGESITSISRIYIKPSN